MKKLVKVAIVAICFLVTGNLAKAQTKIGYVTVDQIMQLMPEMKTIQTTIDAFIKPMAETAQGMQKEDNDKRVAYGQKQATMNEAQRKLAEQDIADLEKRMQDFETNAQQQRDAKVQELMKPVNERVRTAINAVAKEKGYTYVYNANTVEFIIAPETDDITAAVKAKLNLSGTAAPAASNPAVKKP